MIRHDSEPSSGRFPDPRAVDAIGGMALGGNIQQTGGHHKGEIYEITDYPEVKQVSGLAPVALYAPAIIGRRNERDGTTVGLYGVVLVADAAYAVVGNSKDGKLKRMSVVELAVGVHANPDGEPATGKEIGTLDVDKLSRPDDNNVVPVFGTLQFGRDNLKGSRDVSRDHFAVTADIHGRVTIHDGKVGENMKSIYGSSNGTSLISGASLSNPGGVGAAFDFISELHQLPETWQVVPSLPEHTRIVRAQ